MSIEESVRFLVTQVALLEQAVEKAKARWGETTGTTADLEEMQRELVALKNRMETLK